MRTAPSPIATVGNFLLILAVLTALPAVASAQSTGIRAGVSIDPDQFYFGGHFESDALADRVHFRPNIEAGLGNDLTLIALNFEFVYKFPQRNQWRIYAGGGPAVNFFSFDRGPDRDNDTESEAGLNFLIGVEHRQGLFFEFKVGAIDSPELKFGVGWSFSY